MEHLMENALMARARGSPDPAAYLDAKFPIRRASQVEKIIDGAEGKHEKVVQLPGRTANPRRLQLWESLSSNKTLFDVCLRASDREVACNSLLLAEESVFFTAKFSNPDFGGSSRLVELQDVDGDTLETVVAALLTATIKLDRDNIERILHCADMLQLTAVKDACCQYMSDCLDEHSAAATLSLAAKFSCDSLQAYTQQYIVAKFHTMRPDALKECTRAVFWDLISRDDLSIYSELQVLTAITVWCNHNGTEAFLQLLPAVRVENLSSYELQIMSQHAMVLEHPAAVKQLDTALATVYSPNSPPRGLIPGPRKPRGVVTMAPSCSREAAFVRDRKSPLCLGAGRLVARERPNEDALLEAQRRRHDEGRPAQLERLRAGLRLRPPPAPVEEVDPQLVLNDVSEDDAEEANGARGRRAVVRRRVAVRH